MPDPKADPAGFRPRRPPPQFPLRRPALFARMPPAIFPALMGALGVGLALRRCLEAFGLPSDAAELALGIAVALWLFAAMGYAVKLARRPSVLLDDLRVLPGRAGLSAGVLSLMLAATAMAPYWPGVAQAALFLGLGLQAGLAALILWLVWRGPAEQRVVTPAWHLHFVGFIIGGLAAVPLGLTGLATVLLWATIPVAVAIWLASLWQMVTRIPPAPLRPLLAIHLAPASLFAIVAGSLNLNGVMQAAAIVAGLLLVALLFASRWLTESGFSALWGAFTFPLAACSGALFVLHLDVTAAILLALAAGLTLTVLLGLMRGWMSGDLAARTNAAEA